MNTRLTALLFAALLLPALLSAGAVARADADGSNPLPSPSPVPAEALEMAEQPIAPLLGDGNGDGLLTAADAAALLRDVKEIRMLDELTLELGDITQSGEVNDADVRSSLWIAAGLIPDPVKFMERVSTGLCDESLFDRFRYDGVTDDEAGNYQSASVSVTTTRAEAYNSVYYVSDIYVQDISCLATAFSGGRYRGHTESVEAMAGSSDAVVAINGDYYTAQHLSPVIRNGKTYMDGVNSERDVALLTWAGDLLTYKVFKLSREELAERDVYQSWVFGPVLLDEAGIAETTFNSRVSYENPRAAIGCYAPGHYCFILVDGRQEGYSRGMSLKQLAEICQSLGLKTAYNLDGGQSAAMATRYGLVSQPVSGGRTISDIVYIRDIEA